MFENVTSRYDMSDATVEIIVILSIAFLLGLLLGYLLSQSNCEKRQEENNELETNDINTQKTTETPSDVIPDSWKPSFLSAPMGSADDLKRISGVGPVLEKTLNELGIFHYKQIAELSSNNVSWLNNYMAFPGRIERENWVSQARDLMQGIQTDFANRYDKGQTS